MSYRNRKTSEIKWYHDLFIWDSNPNNRVQTTCKWIDSLTFAIKVAIITPIILAFLYLFFTVMMGAHHQARENRRASQHQTP